MDYDRFFWHFPYFKPHAEDFKKDHPDFLTAHLQKDQILATPGAGCQALPFLYSGLIRVYQISETGKELTLYTIGPGESCILTSNCILENVPFPARAQVLEPGEGVLLPAPVLQSLVQQSPYWRDFVFHLVGQRLAGMMSLVSEIAFHRLDDRLMTLLTKRADFGKVKTTHEALAAELGSSREVISRLLKDWEFQGKIVLKRGEILIL